MISHVTAEVQPILKEGTRILTPGEYDALLSAVKKQDYRIILATALVTGMRYVELQRLQRRRDWFIPERRCIHLPAEAQRKPARVFRERYVHLPSWGVEVVRMFFYVRPLPHIRHFNMLLRGWAARTIGMRGVSAKTFRKTWECWLAVSYPDMLDLVAMNQGHTNLTALRHYLQLPFSEAEKAEIKNRTAGWKGGAAIE